MAGYLLISKAALFLRRLATSSVDPTGTGITKLWAMRDPIEFPSFLRTFVAWARRTILIPLLSPSLEQHGTPGRRHGG